VAILKVCAAKTGRTQHRSATRAPHGSPEFTDKISFYCTAKQKREFLKKGRSAWARLAIQQAIDSGVKL
jgi:hypothetical protein